ncbi:hypothetical protein [Luteimonas mephitis]|uniref:hypothetical protein n=1 Tax=Luteimonas mephitis TaxID=83615 RepID=UPI003A94FF60
MARLVADTSSTGTMGRHYNFFLSEDGRCAATPMISLGGRMMADDHQVLPDAAIPAGQPVTLVVQYREARPGQMRSCGNVARFAPEAGRSYDVQFNVTNQGASCAISVRDVLSGSVSLESSDACHAQIGRENNPVPNGEALITNIEVQIQRYP